MGKESETQMNAQTLSVSKFEYTLVQKPLAFVRTSSKSNSSISSKQPFCHPPLNVPAVSHSRNKYFVGTAHSL